MDNAKDLITINIKNTIGDNIYDMSVQVTQQELDLMEAMRKSDSAKWEGKDLELLKEVKKYINKQPDNVNIMKHPDDKSKQKRKYIIALCLSCLFLLYQILVSALYSNTLDLSNSIKTEYIHSNVSDNSSCSLFEVWPMRDEVYRAQRFLKIADLYPVKGPDGITLIDGIATANYRDFIPFNRLIITVKENKLLNKISNREKLNGCQYLLCEAINLRKSTKDLILYTDTIRNGQNLPKALMILGAIALVLFFANKLYNIKTKHTEL